MIGFTLGPYEIIEVVGQGGMGTVYRAYQPAVERFVAVKVMRQTEGVNPNTRGRFQHEARLIARLEHPHLLPVYDFDGTHDPPYLVMRYLEGCTLKDVLGQIRLSPAEAGFFLTRIATPLDYAHRQGVVHQDIKPSNVMLDLEGHLFLADFGIARLIDQANKAPAALGTPDYMAPEQALGQPDIDHRADIYALGAVLFQLLTGRVPFYDLDSPLEVIRAHLDRPVPAATAVEKSLPVAIDQVIAIAMAKSPADRFQHLPDFLTAVKEALGPPLTEPSTILKTAVKTIRDQLSQKQAQRQAELDAIMASFAAQRGLDPTTAMQPAPTEQLKQVTVFYANLAEYSEQLSFQDVEVAEALLGQLWQRLERVIQDFGGQSRQQSGHSALGLWGLETTLERDPERAVRAALALRSQLRQFLDDELEPDEALPMQIGITTGTVMVTPDAETGSLSPSGAPLSLVNRVERLAPPGSILISHDTYRHVRGVFDVEPAESLRIRGRQASVPTYLVHQAKARALRVGLRNVEGVETHMVGRRTELTHLQQAFKMAVNEQQTQMVTIIGEPGLGKSRLLYEFGNWAELQPEIFWLFQARATPENRHRPYALLRDLFVTRMGIQDSDSQGTVHQKLEQGVAEVMANSDRSQAVAHFIGQLIGFDFSASPHLIAVLDDQRRFQAEAQHHLQIFFGDVAKNDAVVIQLEDIHWADDSSLDIIDQLVKQQRELKLLIVALARPELRDRRPDWGGESRLELQALTRSDEEQLVNQILQKVEFVPDQLLNLILERSEGNPLYVEELIKMLIEDRVILKEEPTWRVEIERLAQVKVPPTLTALLQSRMDALFPTERLLLQRAAVIGRIFWSDALIALDSAEAESVDVSAALESLTQRQLVFVRDASTFESTAEYIFMHAILRDVAYDSVIPSQRQHYHAGTAQWLIDHSGERVNEYAGLIGDHFDQAGEQAQAGHYLSQAGEQAFQTSAFREALAYYERGDSDAGSRRGRCGEIVCANGDGCPVYG